MHQRGLSVIELCVTIGIVAVLLSVAMPMALTVRPAVRVRAATRMLATRVMYARSEAIRRGAAIGIRFEAGEGPGDYIVSSYVDGDDDGIQSEDISLGIDQPLEPSRPALGQFPTVRFGLEPDVPLIGATGSSIGDRRPVRLGNSGILTVTPIGTSSSGTLYLHADGGPQYAMRVFGATGRITVLRFDFARRVWDVR